MGSARTTPQNQRPIPQPEQRANSIDSHTSSSGDTSGSFWESLWKKGGTPFAPAVISIDEASMGYHPFAKGAARKFVIDAHGLLGKMAT
jgi:hypothetical protein